MLCRIAPWDCFGDAIASFIGYFEVTQESGSVLVLRIGSTVLFDTTPNCFHARAS